MEEIESNKLVEDVRLAVDLWIRNVPAATVVGSSFKSMSVPIEALPFLREIWRAQDVTAGEIIASYLEPAVCQFEFDSGSKCGIEESNSIHDYADHPKWHKFRVI